MHPSQSTSSISATLVNTNQITTSANVSFSQIAQVTNADEQPSTSQCVYPLAAVSAQCSEKIQFNKKREAVDDEFWNNFKEKFEEARFYELFHSFLSTSWKPTDEYVHRLGLLQENLSKINAHGASQRPEDILLHHEVLMEVFLHSSLRLRAMSLIYAITDLYEINSQLDDPHIINKNEIIKKQNRKIYQINQQYRLIFSKVYLPYQAYLEAANSQDIADDITTLKKTIYSAKKNVTRYQKEISEKHSPFINECLLSLKLHQKMPYPSKNSFADRELSQEQGDVLPSKRKRRVPDKSVYTFEMLEKTVQSQETHSTDVEYPNIPFIDASMYQTKSSKQLSNELRFTSFLNKIIGKDKYIYYEINIPDDESIIISPEKYYHSLIMLSALSAQVSLLGIKISAAKLIQADSQTNKTLARKDLREKLCIFIDNHLIYEKNIAISLDEKINQQPADMSAENMRYCYFSNCNNIKKIKLILENILRVNSKIIQNNDDAILVKCYLEFVNSVTAMSRIKKNYALSYERITQIAQSVFNIPSETNLTKEELLALKFQINRPSVDDSFWQALKNDNLSESELKRYYFHFILTGWRSPLNKVYELEQIIKKARKNHLDLQFRVNLIEKHFQEKLRYLAFYLIHHLLQIIEKCQRLMNLPEDIKVEKKIMIEYQTEVSLTKIKENYQKVLMLHLDYLIARRSPESVDIKKLSTEINTCKHYVHSNIKVDTEDTKLHILLINEILVKNESLSFTAVFEQIYDYINNKACATPVSAGVSDNYIAKQLQFPNIEKPMITRPLPLANELDSLNMSPYVASELQLAEPSLNFGVLAQTSSSSETLHNAISFSLAPATENRVQALRPSIELEQEQILEQPISHIEEVGTFDFLNF